MPVNVKDIREMFGKDVFTSKGYYCGKITDMEFDLTKFKIRSLVIDVPKGSILERIVGGKKGVIIPYPMVQAIGDIIIIKHPGATLTEEGEVTEEG